MIFRAAGYVALATALGVGIVHALAVVGRVPVSVLQLLAVALPILATSALAYIIAGHRVAAPPRPPLWMLLVWTAAFGYMFVNARLANQIGPTAAPAGALREVRELSGHVLAFLVVVGLGMLAVTRRTAPEGTAERAA